ncbi:MAG TPA: extracellular solute-binding protein, partial [Deinococcales bacterium]|nr:extracellular solute-binding protein [Deinococcales bacterium]
DQWGTFMVPWDALFLPIVLSYGGNLLTSDGQKATLLQKDTLDAFTFANDLINKYHVAPPIKEANSYNWIDGWVQQKFGMILQGRWATPIYIDAMTKAKAKFTFDVAPSPMGKVRRTVGYSDALGILKGSKNPAAAFKWIEFVTGDQGQTVLGGPASLVVPANKNIAKSLVSPGAQPEHAEVFITEAKYAVAPPQTPSFSALYDILNRNLNEAFLGLKPVRDALAKADKEIDAMIQQANQSLPK